MKNKYIKAELRVAINAAKIAGKKLTKDKNNVIVASELKNDIKLLQDNHSNEIILNYLKKNSKIQKFISEEGEDNNFYDEYYWIVDPLDGSYNYFRKLNFCCISIALWLGKKSIFGVIYDFQNDQMYYNDPTVKKCFLNSDEITNKNTLELKRSCVGSGIPSGFNSNDENTIQYFNFLNKFKKIRFYGSAAMTLCFVAESKLDAYHESEIFLWDIAAGLAICKEIGLKYKIVYLNKFKVNLTVGNSKVLKELY